MIRVNDTEKGEKQMFKQKEKKTKKSKRFKVVSQEVVDLNTILTIYVDTQTGVNYLGAGVGQGITPLLDAEGKVVITPVNKE